MWATIPRTGVKTNSEGHESYWYEFFEGHESYWYEFFECHESYWHEFFEGHESYGHDFLEGHESYRHEFLEGPESYWREFHSFDGQGQNANSVSIGATSLRAMSILARIL